MHDAVRSVAIALACAIPPSTHVRHDGVASFGGGAVVRLGLVPVRFVRAA